MIPRTLTLTLTSPSPSTLPPTLTLLPSPLATRTPALALTQVLTIDDRLPFIKRKNYYGKMLFCRPTKEGARPPSNPSPNPTPIPSESPNP